MRTREWTIRARIFALLVIPITSLTVLWVFATTLTVGSAKNLLATQINYTEAGKPAETLVAELQQERRLATVAIGSTKVDVAAIAAQRARTSEEVERYLRHVGTERFRDAAPPEAERRIDELRKSLEQLPALRHTVDGRQLDRTGALRRYTTIIDAVYRTYTALPGIDESSISRDSRTVIALSRARELLSQEDAYLSGVAAAGRFEHGEPGELAELIGTQRFLFADSVVELPAKDNETYRRALLSDAGSRVRTMEDTLITEARAGLAVPIDMTDWRGSYETLNRQLRDAEFEAGAGVIDRGRPVGVAIVVRLVLAAGLGLLALLASVLVSYRVGRNLVRRLTALERTARELAEERLPSVVDRLRRGATVDVATEAPALDFGGDELGRVGEAFSAVQRTAVTSAVQEARLRSGLNTIFLNIARRSQALLHRQLALLDAMERRTVDPEQLKELFRVDHLATRMRRNAEDLVILAGATPRWGWRRPVPAIDVIRGAISEVEDYSRVTPKNVPDLAVVGPAVADLIHLLAELIENATSFSPPHTPVTVSAQRVPKGLAIDIEDRGLGLSKEAVEEANRRLAEPPRFDPEHSSRLGLFVVATLAARHSVKVTLRRSPYGGVTAVVLIPGDLVTEVQRELAITATDRASGGRAVLPATPQPADPPPFVLGAADREALPKRRRQASLCPKLSETPPAIPAVGWADRAVSATRTPEQIRSTMSALQAGLRRGRKDAAAIEAVSSSQPEAEPESGGQPEAEPESGGQPEAEPESGGDSSATLGRTTGDKCDPSGQ